MPVANVPIEANRSLRRSASSACLRSVMSVEIDVILTVPSSWRIGPIRTENHPIEPSIRSPCTSSSTISPDSSTLAIASRETA